MARNKPRKKPGPEDIPQLKAMGLTAVNTAGHGMAFPLTEEKILDTRSKV